MLNKVSLGTANFIKPYGILSEFEPLSQTHIHAILSAASSLGISSLDTALAYGDMASVIPKHLSSSFQIITKISILDKEEAVLKHINAFKGISPVAGMLIHDPQHIKLVDKHKLQDWLAYLKQDIGISKIGVSVYDMNDLEQFNAICMPDIVQIPLNPFNQSFNNESFSTWVKTYKPEVHARSLFLQGVLLSDKLPQILEPIKSFWVDFQESVKHYPSRLHAVLQWAAQFDWIKNWVLGLSSVDDFQEIVHAILKNKEYPTITFQSVNHPLVDPRNWKNAYA